MDRSVAATPLGDMAHDLSLWGLFLQADWVVKLVMVWLLLASVLVWAIIFDKLATLGQHRLLFSSSSSNYAPGEQEVHEDAPL